MDNTSDANKPVSTATQTALDLKQDASTAATDAELTSAVAGLVTLAPGSSSRNVVQPSGASFVPLVLKGATSQSGALTEWQDNSSVVRTSISPTGNLAAGRISATAGQEGWFVGDIGFGAFNIFGIGHAGAIAASGTTRFALAQSGLGQTFLNAANLQTIEVRLNNVSVGNFSQGSQALAINGVLSTAFATGNAAVIARGLASQTGDLFQAQSNTPTVLFAVSSAGLPHWVAAANQQTTVGAAGGASALPATPTKYLKIKDSAGTTLVVPAYAA